MREDVLQTGAGRLVVRRARGEEAGVFLEILEEAERWLDGRGNRQWVPGAHRAVEKAMAGMVAAGSVYFAEREGEVVGCCSLAFKGHSWWVDRSTKYGYLSKLTVRDSVRGYGVGRAMMGWVEEQSREAGKRGVRLDCWADNPRLCRYYEEAGYVRVGESEGYGGYRLALYEKAIGRG